MLVIKDIKYNGDFDFGLLDHCSGIRYSVRDVYNYTIYDSDLDKTYNNLQFNELLDLCNKRKINFETILGVGLEVEPVIAPIDYITWKLLDYVSEVKTLSNTENLVSDGNYCINLKYELLKLDSLGIIWQYGDQIKTLSWLYSFLLKFDILSDCKSLTFISEENSFKIDVNEDIKKLMTKVKVLGNKVCW